MADRREEQENIKRNALVDTLIKVGAGISIPLAAAGIFLHSNLKVETALNLEQQKQLENQQKQIEKLNLNDKEISKEIVELKVVMGKMEVKLDGANEKLTEIRSLVLEQGN